MSQCAICSKLKAGWLPRGGRSIYLLFRDRVFFLVLPVSINYLDVESRPEYRITACASEYHIPLNLAAGAGPEHTSPNPTHLIISNMSTYCIYNSDSNLKKVFETGFKEDMTEAEAVELVKQAILSGVFNDLGSGSNVDVTVIRPGGETAM